ncbi:MAG: tetratricopeptide repeat protein [Pikeienuella sp.]
MKYLLSAVIIAASSSFALAAGSGSSSGGYSSTSNDTSAFGDAKKLVNAGEYTAAIPKLKAVTVSEPGNADAFNLLAFSYRKSGDLDNAAPNYAKALELNPKHRGALEYQGEMYLQLGQVEKAEANLQRIDDICWLSCDEERQLQNAIDEWRAKNGS